MSSKQWDEVPLRDVIRASFSGPSPTCEERNVRGDEWGVLKTTCSTWDFGWDPSKHKVLPPEYWGRSHLEVRPGDSIITKAGPRHRVGVPAYVSDVQPRIVPSGKMICLRPDSSRIEPGFLALALGAKRTQLYLDQRTTGMAESQVNFENGDLFGAPLWLPTVDEQRRILRPIDEAQELVDTLRREIAKRRAVRQGISQQLLTNKTRLAGFSGEWQPGALGDVLTVRHGRSQKGVETSSGTIPILATGGQIGWADRPLYAKPSVLIGRKGTIDRPQFQDRPFWTVDTLFYTEISPRADPKFLYYFFQTVDWRSMNEASGVPSLSSTRVESVSIQLPSLSEQVAIRQVIDDAELEIEVLTLRLRKARSVRTGMIQKLLTGGVQRSLETTS